MSQEKPEPSLLLWQHDPEQPISRITIMSLDGLVVDHAADGQDATAFITLGDDGKPLTLTITAGFAGTIGEAADG